MSNSKIKLVVDNAPIINAIEKQLKEDVGLKFKLEKLLEKINNDAAAHHLPLYSSVTAYMAKQELDESTTSHVNNHALIYRGCLARCELRHIPVERMMCLTYGEVNAYPIWIIREVLDAMGF